jgi:hypothetical protein
LRGRAKAPSALRKILDVSGNLLAYGRQVEEFLLDEGISGVFGKQLVAVAGRPTIHCFYRKSNSDVFVASPPSF